MKRIAVVMFLALLSFAMISSARASPDPLANLRVIPVGAVHTGMAIIEASPADLMMFVTTDIHQARNVWLVVVLVEATYDAIDTVVADGITFPRSIFTLAPIGGKLLPKDPSGTYPGCLNDDNYEVQAVYDQLTQLSVTPGDMYVAYLPFTAGPVTTNPIYFTVTLNFASPVEGDVAALILANGRTDPPYDGPFDMKTPFSGSTLVVPELASVLLMIGLFTGAFGLYTIRRKK